MAANIFCTRDRLSATAWGFCKRSSFQADPSELIDGIIGIFTTESTKTTEENRGQSPQRRRGKTESTLLCVFCASAVNHFFFVSSALIHGHIIPYPAAAGPCRLRSFRRARKAQP